MAFIMIVAILRPLAVPTVRHQPAGADGVPDIGEVPYRLEIPDLELFDPQDRNVTLEARIEDAKRAERAARRAPGGSRRRAGPGATRT